MREGNEFVKFHELGLVTLMEAIPANRPGKWPSAQWLMLCLAAVAGADCPIFHKGYQPTVRKAVVEQPRVIENPDDFFSNCKEVSILLKRDSSLAEVSDFCNPNPAPK